MSFCPYYHAFMTSSYSRWIKKEENSLGRQLRLKHLLGFAEVMLEPFANQKYLCLFEHNA